MNDETHTGPRRAADKVADIAGGMVGRAKARSAGSHDDQAFVQNAARGDMLEIEAARYMLENSQNEDVRAAAKQMIDDHTAMTQQLTSALRSTETPDDLSAPNDLDERRQGLLNHLKAAPEEKIDKTYLDQQVLAHKETVDLFEGYSQHGANAELRSVALEGLPVVRRHLAHMEQLQSRLS